MHPPPVTRDSCINMHAAAIIHDACIHQPGSKDQQDATEIGASSDSGGSAA